MRILLTGPTGYVGSAIARELLAAGYSVNGLAGSEAEDTAVRAAGMNPVRGSVTDLDSLTAAAASVDGVIHEAALQVGPGVDFLEACAIERRAVVALGTALVGSDRPFVVTSGIGLIAPGVGGLRDEGGALDPDSPAAPRAAMEVAALAFAERGVRVSVVRFAWAVHSEGATEGFLPALVAVARERGLSGYPGDGTNRWSAVHRDDLARLYRLALEAAPAGARLHAVHDEGVPLIDIARVIGRHLGIPVEAVAPSDAREHFGWLAGFVGYDGPASSTATRRLLGWKPEHPGLIDDLEAGHYFTPAPSR